MYYIGNVIVFTFDELNILFSVYCLIFYFNYNIDACYSFWVQYEGGIRGGVKLKVVLFIMN